VSWLVGGHLLATAARCGSINAMCTLVFPLYYATVNKNVPLSHEYADVCGGHFLLAAVAGLPTAISR
jgi:hypothetical protein